MCKNYSCTSIQKCAMFFENANGLEYQLKYKWKKVNLAATEKEDSIYF